jgi:hypothetical protein
MYRSSFHGLPNRALKRGARSFSYDHRVSPRPYHSFGFNAAC